MGSGVLVLCEAHDVSALWVADELRRRGHAVDVVTGPELGSAPVWEHRIRGDVAEVEIVLDGGGRISGSAPRPVLNRLGYAPVELLRRVGGEDADYAVQEFQALFLSWLSALPGPVLNRPTPQFLAGHWRSAPAWALLAAAAGLATAPLRRTSAEQANPVPVRPPGSVAVLVVAGEAVPVAGVSPAVLAGCAALAVLAGDALLGVDLAPDGTFVSATPVPDLRLAGPAGLDALADALGSTRTVGAA